MIFHFFKNQDPLHRLCMHIIEGVRCMCRGKECVMSCLYVAYKTVKSLFGNVAGVV